jgi:hypothetical protein
VVDKACAINEIHNPEYRKLKVRQGTNAHKRPREETIETGSNDSNIQTNNNKEIDQFFLSRILLEEQTAAKLQAMSGEIERIATMKSAQLTSHLSATDPSISYAVSAFGVNESQIASLPASKKLSISMMAFVHKFNHSFKETTD